MKQYFGYIIALCVVVYIYLTLSNKIDKNNDLINKLDPVGIDQKLSAIGILIDANSAAHAANTAASAANRADRDTLFSAVFPQA